MAHEIIVGNALCLRCWCAGQERLIQRGYQGEVKVQPGDRTVYLKCWVGRCRRGAGGVGWNVCEDTGHVFLFARRDGKRMKYKPCVEEGILTSSALDLSRVFTVGK